jgi:hypothetical protein
MSLIKFPTQIKPSRVTVQLMRVDETVASPLTNIQQVVSRGNPAWKWTYEYTNLSESEREIVQAFLLNCRGSLNTFKVTDPGDYSIRGTMSDWTDVYSGRGEFFTVPGSSSNKVNSWFGKTALLHQHITDDGSVNFDWRGDSGAENLKYLGDSSVGYISLTPGALYAARVKQFSNEYDHSYHLQVSSETTLFLQTTEIRSPGIVTFPFYAGQSGTNMVIAKHDTPIAPVIGKQFTVADWRLARAAMVVNTENMVTYSNKFDSWTTAGCDVESGFANDPLGGENWWRLFVNSDDGVSNHYLTGNITVPGSEDIHTIDLYMKDGIGLSTWALHMGDITNYVRAWIDLSVASIYNVTAGGNAGFPFAKVWSAGGSGYRVQLTGHLGSDTAQNFRLYLVNSDDSLSFAPTDSVYVHICNAGWRRGPVLGASLITTDTAVVGSSQNWSGSKIRLSGFDADTIIKAGTRFELINQYHDDASDVYERSEFKRVTREVQVGMEGHALIEFDPPIRNAPTPDFWYTAEHRTVQPIAIFQKPEMKARLLNGTIQYIDKPLRMTDIVFDVLEDLTE